MDIDANNKDSENIVDVIDNFDYSTQHESYNEKFRRWRRKRDNRFSFSFANNSKESVYIDGRGFIVQTVADAEKKVLSDIFYNIGFAVLIYITFHDVLNRLIISALGFVGVDIHSNYFSSAIYGGSVEIVTVLIVENFIKILIPLLYVHFRFRLPFRVEFMFRMNNPYALFGAISMTLVACAALSVPSAYSDGTREMYKFFSSVETDLSAWDQAEFVVYTIFEVVIMSIISEMFFRGALFAVLRQFGDIFAILTTSMITALLTQDLNKMPAVFVISVISSYGMVASGTIFTSFSVVTVYKMYLLAIAIIETNPSETMPLTRNLFMILTLVVGGLGLLLYWLYVAKAKKYGIANYKSEFPFEKRLFHAFKTFPFSVVVLLCMAYAIKKAMM